MTLKNTGRRLKRGIIEILNYWNRREEFPGDQEKKKI